MMGNGSNYSSRGNGHDREQGGESQIMGQRNESYDEERGRREQPWNPSEQQQAGGRPGYGQSSGGNFGEQDERGSEWRRHSGRDEGQERERPERRGEDWRDGLGQAGRGRQYESEGGYGQAGGYGQQGGYERDPWRPGDPGGRSEALGRNEGGHRGKGPKGYRRSDDRIKEDICERLTEDDALDASNIEIEVADGEVTLTGEVDNRAAKRRAEDLADDAPGVTHVQNNIRVSGR